MKTLELKLKKDVLIVEIPRLADYEFINRECKYLKVGNEEIKLNASTLDKFEFLCKGSELTEEIASELMIQDENYEFKDIKFKEYTYEFSKEAFMASVEISGFYWLENHIKRIELKEWNGTDYTFGKYMIEFNKAAEKTFKNPLIFVKK